MRPNNPWTTPLRHCGAAALLSASALVLMVTSAVATVVDSPLPLLGGQRSKHVFTVPGVTSGVGALETVFLCTSLEKKKDIVVGIEVFDHDPGGPLNDVTDPEENGVLPLAPGETVAFETNDPLAFDEDETITPSDNANHGSARIVSTSTKLACTALLVDEVNSPPTSMVNLQVIKKTSQKGD